ncbi:type II toxin-antitoxin system mRNA interferase toxin, RelE/StbE family [Lactobacillus rodentium]|uniref:type II toxin-antitoxin system mRNA interferase toxin, RelE/StbE family n=1 Tax=Lactobacillus rodentium TaxID=947835 RepID=UPI000E3DDF94
MIISKTIQRNKVHCFLQYIKEDFHDHELIGNYAGYREFHLRDTPKGYHPSEINNILVIYKINNQDLVLVAVDIGSHKKVNLFLY